MTIDKNRTLYFDYLRILSTVGVIVIHVTFGNVTNIETGWAWHIHNIFDGAFRFAVPIFFMISGALFLDPNRELTLKKLYSKNILRLMVSFFFWSLLYAIVYFRENIPTVIMKTAEGHYHMWFVPTLIGLYVITPILRKIAESRKIIKYFLVISTLVYFVPLLLYNLLNLTNIDKLMTIANVIRDFVSSFNFKLVQGYSFYFILGYFLSTAKFNTKRKWIIYVMGALGFALTIGLTAMYSKYNGKFVDFYSYLSIPVLFESLGIFVFAKCELSKINLGEKGTKFISSISKYTFGCYLIHIFVLDAIRKYLQIDSLSIHPLIAVPVITGLTFAVSIGISAILNHIPVVKKYLV